MPTYLSMLDVVDPDVQNVQELASVWGDVRTELREFDAEIRDTYAMLGDYDFVMIFDAADRDEAFKVALALERQGLDAQTMEAVPTDRFAQLVEDV